MGWEWVGEEAEKVNLEAQALGGNVYLVGSHTGVSTVDKKNVACHFIKQRMLWP